MEIGKSFSYVFDDPGWIRKIAIGGGIVLAGTLLSFLLAIPLLVAVILTTGYYLTVVRNVYDGSLTPLPEWNDFGGFFRKGLVAAIGALVILLPGILLNGNGIVLNVAAVNASSSFGSSQDVSEVLNFVSIGLQCLAALYSLVATVYLYAATTRYALTDHPGTFWDFGGNLAFIQSNVGQFILAFIVVLLVGLLGALGFILCFIPGFFTTFWSSQVAAHILGQYARTAGGLARTTPPMAPTPPPLTPTNPA